jgi:hypothetical protein
MSQAVLPEADTIISKTRKHVQFRAKRESQSLSEAGRQMPGARLLHYRLSIREGKEKMVGQGKCQKMALQNK